MYDRQTNTLWSQLLGKAVDGPLAGTVLEFLPSFQTTWGDWKERYPETLALQKGYAGAGDPYDSYYLSDQTGVIGETVRDDRLQPKEFVIGVAVGDESVAYPFSVLNAEPVVNDLIGDVPLLVVFDKETGSGIVYNRFVKEDLLTFYSEGDLLLRDKETGSTWDGLTGAAVDGPMKGMILERVKSTQSFWFGWKDFYQDTNVYSGTE